MEVLLLLTKYFGNCPQTRVIDLLVSHPWSEFTKSEMAEGANIGRPTLYKFFNELLEDDLIEPVRKIGNTQLYKVNYNSPVIKAISECQRKLADIEAEKQVEIYEEEIDELDDDTLDELMDMGIEPQTELNKFYYSKLWYSELKNGLDSILKNNFSEFTDSSNELKISFPAFKSYEELLTKKLDENEILLKKLEEYEILSLSKTSKEYLQDIETDNNMSKQKAGLIDIEYSQSNNLMVVD